MFEANAQAGGGTRSRELTLAGFTHDLCSAVHPLACASPAFKRLDLEGHGVEWVHPSAPLAHPVSPDRAVVLERSLRDTAAALGRDRASYERAFSEWVDRWEALLPGVLAPPLGVPARPVLMARFAGAALRSADRLVAPFRTTEARALLAGIVAHGVLPFERAGSAAAALVLGAAGHTTGWPIPRGGSQRIADALVAALEERGGRVETGHRVGSLAELPKVRAVLLDLTPKQVLDVAGDALPDGYRRALARFRYAPGVFKLDWALSEPIPWRSPECARAATVHVGGTYDEIAAAEGAAHRGEVPRVPFVLLAQPSRFDPTRAPQGKHTAWAYCRVPAGSDVDMTTPIERQVERFAPGFRDTILARCARGPAALEADNPNLVGGDLTGGLQDLRQTFFRPVPTLDPYRTPASGLYLCSSSTPPGGGVHGMCGYHAARSALRNTFGIGR